MTTPFSISKATSAASPPSPFQLNVSTSAAGFSLGSKGVDCRRIVRVRSSRTQAPDLPELSSPPKKNVSISSHDSPSESPTPVISLRVLVDKKNNRVVFAESSKDFIDLLFSFLTLPIGTILRLLTEKSPPTLIGCMNNISTSVGNLDARLLRTEACKEMLLRPRRSSEAQSRNIKLKIFDDLDPIKCFYFCQNTDCRDKSNLKLSDIPNVRCQCGRVMNQLATLLEPVGRASNDDEGEGVFVKGSADLFLISDDLQVMPGSTSHCVMLLKKLGINDANELDTQSVNAGQAEILQLLRLLLVSKTPLTHWILMKQDASDLTEHKLENMVALLDKRSATTESKKISLKLFKSKSQSKILYAESEDDFVDFLFSLLTFPLGSIIKLLDGKSSLGCVDNLYRSVKDLSTDNYLKSEELKAMLLCPKLAPFHACDNQLLHIAESTHPQYSINYVGSTIEWSVCLVGTEPNGYSFGEELGWVSIVNPKYSAGETTCGGGFVKGPAKFMVTDALVVTQLSPISSISFLAKLNVAITDVDEIVVRMDEEEALNLLKAALVSKTALTDVFNKAYQCSRVKCEK